MPDLWMDVDTALSEVPINLLPLIDDTDFKTREESVVYNQAGLDLVWNFVTTAGAMTQTAVTPTDTAGDYDWVNQGNGLYTIEIPASGGASINNDTEGFGWFTGFATGVLPWRGPVIGFRAAALNNSLIDAGTTGLLAPTTAARTLDVTATGAAGIDWGNVENQTTAVDLSATDIQLADTVTTLTGHTPQTGDSFARIGVAGAGLTNIDLPDQTMNITGNITGNLSGSVGSVTGAVGSVTGAVGSVTGNVGGNVTGSVGSVLGGIDTSGGTITTLDGLDTAQDTQHATTLSKLLKYVQLILRKDSAIATDNATELTAINANGGSGAGAFDNTTDSQEGIRDNTAWNTATTVDLNADQSAVTIGTVTTNTDMRGTDNAATAASLATAQADLDTITGADGVTLATAQGNYAPSTHAAADVWSVATRVLTSGTNLNDITVADILTTAMTESYAADGVAPTLAQAIFLIQQHLTEFAVSGTTWTTKKLDGSTTAATFTLDDATNPTSSTRAT